MPSEGSPVKDRQPKSVSFRTAREADHSSQKSNTARSSGENSDLQIALLERESAYSAAYGWGSLQPDCMQCMTKTTAFLICLCLLMFANGFGVYGVFPSTTFTLYRRFFISLQTLGFIRMSYDAGILIALLPALYFGNRATYRPQWIGLGAMTMCLGSLVCTLPHLLVGPYSEILRSYSTDKCGAPSPVRELCKQQQHLRMFKYIFMSGMFLCGVGAAPLYTMGFAFMDEHVTPRTSNVFTGVASLCGLLGPTVGAMFTTLFIRELDGDQEKPSTFQQTDPIDHHRMHYGAWWLGWIMCAVLSLLAALPMFGFPSRLDTSTATKMHEMAARRNSEKKGKKTVLKKGPFIGLIMDQCASTFLTTSFNYFMPIYLRWVFALPDSKAALLSATCQTSSAVLGLLLGTFVQHHFKIRGSSSIRLSLAASLFAGVCVAVFAVRCPAVPLAGATAPYLYQPNNPPFNLTSECNANCHCTPHVFQSMCDKKHGQGFFSRCFAGCETVDRKQGRNCSCVKSNNNETVGGGYVTIEDCGIGCHPRKVAAFLLGYGWLTTAIYIRMNPVQQSVLRIAAFRAQTSALIMAEVAARVVAAIPATPIMSYLIEISCVAYQSDCGAGDPVCKWADSDKLVLYTALTFAAQSVTSLLGLMLALLTYGEEDDEEPEKSVKHLHVATFKTTAAKRTCKVTPKKQSS